MRSRFAATSATLFAAAWLAAGVACAAPRNDIRGAFSKFVVAQNAHDIRAVGDLLDDSPDFLWIAPGHVVRGRAAAVDRFRELFQRAWRVYPAWPTFQIVMLNVSTAEVIVRVSEAGGGAPRAARMSQILVNTPHGWRVLTIIDTDDSMPVIPG